LLQSRMVDDLLDMARVEHGTMKLDLEILDMAAMIRTALEGSAAHVEKKSIRLEVTQSSEPLFVRGDAGRLQQIFRNILSNAVKFTPSGGAIRVTLSREQESAVLVVSDTGVGIAPEFLPFVFDMFRQQEKGVRRQHEGLGIGFSLVKRLVEIHKGTVEVTSAGTGRGTEVTVRLPLAAQIPDLDDAAPGAGQLSASALAGLALLIVEDSQDSREALRAVLQQLGAEVLVAGDGREALEIVAERTPDLVLCDLRMPVMDGFEFVRELHRAPVSPPVVAISGLASEADRERTREAGFEAHIKKPFDEATVAAAIAAALRHRHGRPAEKRS
jgi:diguanylate cyclase